MEQQPETRILETTRLKLKELTPELWQYIMTTLPDEEIQTSLGLYQQGQLDAEKVKCAGGMTTHAISFKNYLMTDKESGIVIGKIGYHTWQQKHLRAEIGYAIDIEEHKNKGYMSEAMKTVLQDGFEYMGLNRIEAMIGPDNVPSNALVKKFGFVNEGLMREHYNKNGTLVDSFCYSLLRAEYDELKHKWA
jgi:[ribosomal protein S5]-alanine N-acetyltransferase